MSDLLSIFAIVVSVASFAWTLWIENRLERQATSRFAFDAVVTGPVETKLSQAEAVFEELSQCALDNADSVARSTALQSVLRRRFSPWYFSTQALLDAAPTKKVGAMQDTLDGLPDDVLATVNALSLDIAPPTVDGLSTELVTGGTRFIASMRAHVHEARLNY